MTCKIGDRVQGVITKRLGTVSQLDGDLTYVKFDNGGQNWIGNELLTHFSEKSIEERARDLARANPEEARYIANAVTDVDAWLAPTIKIGDKVRRKGVFKGIGEVKGIDEDKMWVKDQDATYFTDFAKDYEVVA